MAFKDWFDYVRENTTYVKDKHGQNVECSICNGYIEEGTKYVFHEVLNEYNCEDCWGRKQNV